MVKPTLAVALLLAAACVAWWLWPVDGSASAPPPAVVPLPPTASASEPPRPQPGGPLRKLAPEPSAPPAADPRLFAEAEVERHCPWPPDPLSWQVLGTPCLEAMDAIMMDDDWRRVLDDPVGTRHAVVEALDRPGCQVPPPVDAKGNLAWPGEVRADLQESCAAGAMVRLAELQELCIANVNKDWDMAYAVDRWYEEARFDEKPDMAKYHHEIADRNHGYARVFWEVYMCRSVPPEALAWVDALPDPPSDLSAIQPAMLRTLEEVTQRLHLYEAARRLGWDFTPARLDMLRNWAARQLEPEPDWPPPGISDNYAFPDKSANEVLPFFRTSHTNTSN